MSPTSTAATPLAARPRLAADVLVHPPAEPGAPWLIERDGRRYFRVSPDLARLAKSLTGEYDQRELLVVLGRPWTAADLGKALRHFGDLKLLDDGDDRSMRRRRVAVVPPFSLQLTVLDPSRILTRLSGLLRLLSERWALLTFLAVAVLGVPALVVQAPTVRQLVAEPIPVAAFVVVLLGNLVATVVHELAHGSVLTRYGGRPRRMGVMLFYLVPAFFCDVSDGWRLPRSAMRVRVALAGIAAQFVIAGAVALSSLATTGGVRDSLVLLALVIYLAATVNVIPFVKFDGYLALMSHLDISGLREKAMGDARSFLAGLLYGVSGERILPRRAWVVPYGLACIVTPLLLMGYIGLTLWSEIFTRMGYIGALANLTLVSLIATGIGREVVRVHRVAGGARRVRMVALDLALLAAVALALTQVHLTRWVAAGYTAGPSGSQLYVASAADAALVRPGQTVELRDNGVLRRPLTGAAVVTATEERRTEVSLTAFTPIEADVRLQTRVALFELEVTAPPDHPRGVARVRIGERPLGTWLYDTYLAPLW